MSVDDFLESDFMAGEGSEVCRTFRAPGYRLTLLVQAGSGSEQGEDDDAESFASVDEFDGTYRRIA